MNNPFLKLKSKPLKHNMPVSGECFCKPPINKTETQGTIKTTMIPCESPTSFCSVPTLITQFLNADCTAINIP